jgi:hypothetical protein
MTACIPKLYNFVVVSDWTNIHILCRNENLYFTFNEASPLLVNRCKI